MFAASAMAAHRNCACGGVCGACQTSAAAWRNLRNCACGGACGSCQESAAALRNVSALDVANIAVPIAHTIGGAVLSAFGGGAAVPVIGKLEDSILGYFNDQAHPKSATGASPSSSQASSGSSAPSSSGAPGADVVQQVLDKLTPAERGKAKAAFDGLPDAQKKMLVAYLGGKSVDEAVSIVRKYLGPSSPPPPAMASGAPTSGSRSAA
jgi:hypothetical protein